MVMIIFYPRLNLDQGFGIPHFGLMHLVATNLVIWIRTVIRESILEFHEAMERKDEEDEEHHTQEHQNTLSDHDHHLLNATEVSCSPTAKEMSLIYTIMRSSAPILFAFIIEFALIGATVFYNMWHHVRPYNKDGLKYPKELPEKPHIKEVITKTDWSHSIIGASVSVFVFILNIITLCIFFGVASDENVIDEYLEKVTRCITNSCGILATFIGTVQIQKLSDKLDPEDTNVDSFLLNLGASFSYLYLCFTVTVGVFTHDLEDVPGSLHVFNGVLGIVQISSQIVFINMLLNKVSY